MSSRLLLPGRMTGFCRCVSVAVGGCARSGCAGVADWLGCEPRGGRPRREAERMGSATGLVDVDVAVRLLGSVDVLVDGRRLSLVGVKQRAIVAMLALETGAVVSVDRLIDGIWGEDSPPSVRSSVHDNQTPYFTNTEASCRKGNYE